MTGADRRRGGALALGTVALTGVVAACTAGGGWRGTEGTGRAIPRTASGFPKKPLTLIAPSNPGGGWDQLARLIQQVMTNEGLLPVPLEVVNRGGAGGTIGLAELATRYRRDPHTVMVGGGVMIGAILTHKSPFGLTDTVPLARLVSEYEVVAVPASSPYRTLTEFLAAFRTDPAAISWGGGSAGGVDHMLVGLLAQAAGVDPRHVNYVAFTGGGEAAAAVMGGQVTAGVSGYGEWKGLAEGGRMRLLGVSAPQTLNGVPSFRESGFDVVLANWRGLVAPPDIAPESRAWLLEALRRLRETAAWREILRRNEWEDSFLPGDAFLAYIQDEEARTARILATLGLGSAGEGYAVVGPWAFPALVGIGLLLSGASVAWGAWPGRRDGNATPAHAEPPHEPLRGPWLATAALLVGYAVLFEPLGFPVATAAYLFLQARALGSRAWRRDATVAAALSAAIYLLFNHVLKIALPTGVLG